MIPAISSQEHEHILHNAEELLQALRLPYRVVVVCGGDLGIPQVKKYDIETWMPSRQAYGETHSASKFHDFQARRLRLRYRDKEGNTRFVHTLNNTVIASPRILIPLLELYQRADGSVAIPEVLQPYMGGMQEIVTALTRRHGDAGTDESLTASPRHRLTARRVISSEAKARHRQE